MKSKNLKTVVALQVDGRTAKVRIVDYIGESYYGTDSATIRELVDEALSQGISEAVVYINSRGGSVIEANEIVNQLKRFTSVKIEVGALAASAATYITSKFYTVAHANSQFMFHLPSVSSYGDVNQLASDLKLLQNITDDYVNAYAQKTQQSKEDIEALLAKGDVWMTASEAQSQGFIDEIIEDDLQASYEDITLLTASGAPQIPNIQTTIPKTKEMERTRLLAVIAALGMAMDATDEAIAQRIEALKSKEQDYDTLKASVDKMQNERIEALLNGAIASKKIDAKEKEVYAKLAANDFESTQQILNGMQAVPKLSAHLGGSAEGGNRKAWTLEDYMDKDPEALERLYKENPEAAADLEKVYFKK
ncbi:MAG: ATP-dependent Clp protease proteolytic subunit [Chitinophagales bacterium]|nr:ATP-dependent Clp protease proteolytic subunit [Chitinophagales bacterium]